MRRACNSRTVSTALGKIAVVGSGAVGCYYGGMLARSGCDVRFLMRRDLEAVKAKGLTIHTGGETLRVSPVQAFGTTAEIGPCDLVIIALKATTNAVLEQLIPPLLHSESMLLTLQNGLGNEEFLAARWGAHRVMGALCFVCLNRTAHGAIEHFDHGSISIGEFRRPPEARTRAMADAFLRAGIDANVVDDLVTERWRKLLWNIPFNGLSIVAGGATVADGPPPVFPPFFFSEPPPAAGGGGRDFFFFFFFFILKGGGVGGYKPFFFFFLGGGGGGVGGGGGWGGGGGGGGGGGAKVGGVGFFFPFFFRVPGGGGAAESREQTVD